MAPRTIAAACGLLMLACALPASAGAATAQVVLSERHGSKETVYFSTLTFTAGDGERNALSVSRDGDAVVFHDDGAEIAAGEGCVAIDPRTVRCAPYPGTYHVRTAALGDADDSLTTTGVSLARGDGGAGADTLIGGGSLYGGAGDDTLVAAPTGARLFGEDGRDTLTGGAGSDFLEGDAATAAQDVIDGGGGRDEASWVAHPAGIEVDLADSGPGGAPGEADAVSGIEDVRGSEHDDVLRGTDGPNSFEGRGGEDVLDGRGGDDYLGGWDGDDRISGGDGGDELDGSSGRDEVDGGAGDDEFDMSDLSDVPEPDRVTCGMGADHVWFPERVDELQASCERIDFLDFGLIPVLRRDAPSLRFRISRRPPDATLFAPCGRIRVGPPTGSMGTAVFRNPRRGSRTVGVSLTARGRRAVAGGAPITVTFDSFWHCGGGRVRGRAALEGYTYVP